jgi:RNA polymerase sigma factor (sigma-70 family)
MPQVTQWQEFARWWVELEPELLRAARRYGGAAGDPQDVVQDLAVLAIKNYPRFSQKEDFRRWAFARIHWLLLDGLRARKALSVKEPSDLALGVSPNQEPEVLGHEIMELVRTLPKRQLKVILLTIQGHSVEAIAKEMKISRPTVRSLRRFGRSRLAMLLANKDLRK